MSLVPGARVALDGQARKDFVSELEHRLRDDLDAHSEREARIAMWDDAYVGEPREKKKMFPWPGAANLEVPLIGFTVDSIVARIVNTIFQPEPFWTIRPLRREVDQIAKPLEGFMDWSRKVEFPLYANVRSNTIEVVKHGWGWYKLGWEVFSTREYVTGAGGAAMPKDVIVRRPNVQHVLNMDVICQAGVEDELQAEHIWHRVRLTDNQLRWRQHDKLYDEVDEVIAMKEDASEQHEALQDSRDQAPPAKEPLNTLYECQIDWPIDGVPVPTLAMFHLQTRRLLRWIHNPYGWRTLKKVKFLEREGRLEGFGIARRLWQMQEELSTIHRQQLDNGTVANTMFFLGKRGDIRPGTQIWPGRVLPVGDVDKALRQFPMGSPGAMGMMANLETRALSYAERSSGISDPQLGRESQSLGSRATATGTLAMIQEGNRRFDLNVRDLREALSEVGRKVLEMNQRFRPQGVAYFVQGADGQYTEQALSLPEEFSVSKLSVELTASTATINRETEKQGLIALLGVTTQYYERLVQLAMLISNPQAPGAVKELGVRIAQGAKQQVDRIVQAFDYKSVDTIVPALLQEQARGEAAGSAVSGSPAMHPGGPPDAGMAAFLGARGGVDLASANGAGGIQ